jgi:hypothetical protein
MNSIRAAALVLPDIAQRHTGTHVRRRPRRRLRWTALIAGASQHGRRDVTARSDKLEPALTAEAG